MLEKQQTHIRFDKTDCTQSIIDLYSYLYCSLFMLILYGTDIYILCYYVSLPDIQVRFLHNYQLEKYLCCVTLLPFLMGHGLHPNRHDIDQDTLRVLHLHTIKNSIPPFSLRFQILNVCTLSKDIL